MTSCASSFHARPIKRSTGGHSLIIASTKVAYSVYTAIELPGQFYMGSMTWT